MAEQGMPISLIEWRPMPRNSLRGFATVRLGKSLKICDVAVHNSWGKRWAQMPGKPQVDKDGTARRDEKGKIQYTPTVAWLDKASADRFSEGVIAAVEREHPGATEADATR